MVEIFPNYSVPFFLLFGYIFGHVFFGIRPNSALLHGNNYIELSATWKLIEQQVMQS